MKKVSLFMICIISIFFVFTVYVQSAQKGAVDIIIKGGKTGNIPFPHARHQKNLNDDCQICHKLFPQKKGIIDKQKEKHILEKKVVMNNCLACHKEMASQGKQTGPVKCNGCHSL